MYNISELTPGTLEARSRHYTISPKFMVYDAMIRHSSRVVQLRRLYRTTVDDGRTNGWSKGGERLSARGWKDGWEGGERKGIEGGNAESRASRLDYKLAS